jgi:hypothetical protein
MTIYGIVCKKNTVPVAVGISTANTWLAAVQTLGDKKTVLKRQGYRLVELECFSKGTLDKLDTYLRKHIVQHWRSQDDREYGLFEAYNNARITCDRIFHEGDLSDHEWHVIEREVQKRRKPLKRW